jgi:ABC-2 type transport system permease protein
LSLGAARALWTRDFQIARSYRLAVLLDLTLGLLNLLVFYFIAKTFAGSHPSGLGPAPNYFAYAGVGVAMSVVINAATGLVATTIRNEQLTGTLEAMLTQPVTSASLAIGMSTLPFAMAFVRAVAYLLLGSLLLGLNFPDANWAGVIAVLASSGVALSSLGVTSAAIVMIIKRGDVVISLAVFALGLFSGAVFPITVFPDWLESIAKVLPTTQAFDGLRAALFGGSGWEDEVLVLALYALPLVPLSLWAFSASMRRAKRSGSVAEY